MLIVWVLRQLDNVDKIDPKFRSYIVVNILVYN